MLYVDSTTEIERVDYIEKKLTTDKDWATRGLVVISSGPNLNFEYKDNNILTSFSDQIAKGRTLSDKQVAILYKLMPKYASLLDSLAQMRIGNTVSR